MEGWAQTVDKLDGNGVCLLFLVSSEFQKGIIPKGYIINQ